MARKAVAKPKSVALEPTEKTTIIALSSQRQQIIAAVNAQQRADSRAGRSNEEPSGILRPEVWPDECC
jgi:hypothetical protein